MLFHVLIFVILISSYYVLLSFFVVVYRIFLKSFYMHVILAAELSLLPPWWWCETELRRRSSSISRSPSSEDDVVCTLIVGPLLNMLSASSKWSAGIMCTCWCAGWWLMWCGETDRRWWCIWSSPPWRQSCCGDRPRSISMTSWPPSDSTPPPIKFCREIGDISPLVREFSPPSSISLISSPSSSIFSCRSSGSLCCSKKIDFSAVNASSSGVGEQEVVFQWVRSPLAEM